LQLQLENGNEEVLYLPPSTTSISQFLNDLLMSLKVTHREKWVRKYNYILNVIVYFHSSTVFLFIANADNNMDVNDMPQEHIDIDEELSYRKVLNNFNRNRPSVEKEAPNKSTESGKRKGRTAERSSNRKYISVFVFDSLILKTSFYVPSL